jgi:hypothetical protein
VLRVVINTRTCVTCCWQANVLASGPMVCSCRAPSSHLLLAACPRGEREQSTPVLAKNRMSATPSGPIPVYSRRREGFSSPEILPPTPCSLKMRLCCAEAGAGADRRSMCGIVAWMEQGHFQGSLQELLGLSSTIRMLVRPCCLQAKQFVLDSEED